MKREKLCLPTAGIDYDLTIRSDRDFSCFVEDGLHWLLVRWKLETGRYTQHNTTQHNTENLLQFIINIFSRGSCRAPGWAIINIWRYWGSASRLEKHRATTQIDDKYNSNKPTDNQFYLSLSLSVNNF